MGSYSYLAWWILSLLVLLFIAAWVGRQTGQGNLGILIDERGRYSLTHFQLVLWTVVILSSMLGVLILKGFDPEVFKLSPELLGLMGISAGSAVAATGVKGVKDAPGSGAKVARAAPAGLEFARSDGASDKIIPHFAQNWLQEEGDQADKIVSITKYQNFIFTLVILGFYVVAALKQGGVPKLPENVVWLIGISHAGYVGGKIPNK